MKTCTKCKIEKPLTDFFARKKGSADGLMSSCKACKTQAVYEWREKNREQLNEYQRQYYSRPDQKEKVKAYWQTPQAKQLARQRDARRSDYKKQWRKDNLEACRIYSRNKNAKRRMAVKQSAESISLKEWHEIVAMYRGCCYYCGQKAKMTIEHMTPLSKGGTHSKDNIVPACMPCNRKKHANDNYTFAQQFGKLF